MAASVRLSQTLIAKDTKIPSSASTPIMASVLKKDREASYSAPAMVLPKDAIMRLVLMMEKFRGKCFSP